MSTFSITDINNFAESMRDGAAQNLSANYTENLDDFISIQQIIGLIQENSVGLDDDDNYCVTEDGVEDIFTSISQRIYNVGLAKLAANDKIECAWDDETNEMVFWSKQTSVN